MFPSAKALFPSAAAKDQQAASHADPSLGDDRWLSNTSYKQPPPSTSSALYEDTRRPVKRQSHDHNVSSDEDQSHKHHKKDRHTHSKKKKSKHGKDKDRESTPVAKPSKPVTIWLDEAGLKPEDSHRVDHKPDVSNLGYDTLYSGDTATYRRRFGDLCLGLEKNAVKFTDSRNQQIKKRKEEKMVRYHHSAAVEKTMLQIPQERKKEEIEDDLSADLLLLSTGEKEEEEEGESAAKESTPEAYIVKQTAQFNQELLQAPHNVGLWLEFIKFQDEAMVWGKLPGLFSGDEEEPARLRIHKQRLALLERKMAIFERALESNPLSEKLLIGHMTLASEVWETEKMVKRWKDVVFKQPHRSLLWLSYIEFCQSRFSFFRFATLKSLYCKAISTLSSILDRSLISHKPEPEAEKRLLAVFLFYCYFLQQCGHTEKAVACLQALVEFNLFCPKDFQDKGISRKERMKYFEGYWDSGAPRVGEEDAVGWASWWERRKSGKQPTPLVKYRRPALSENGRECKEKDEKKNETEENEEEEEVEDVELKLIRGTTITDAWSRLETHRELMHCLPQKEDEEEEEGGALDPERMVLFDDVAQSLFLLQDSSLQQTLLHEFLRFLGAPILCSSFLLSVFPHVSHLFTSPKELFCPQSYLNAISHSLVFHHQPNLLGSKVPFKDFSVHQLLTSSPNASQLSPHVQQFISTLFSQALSTKPSSNNGSTMLAESWLLFELQALKRADGESKARALSLQSLALELLSSGAQEEPKFIWWFVTELEKVLDQKRKPCLLSKQYLQPFATKQLPIEAKRTLPLQCQLFVECILGLRSTMNCYQRHKGDQQLALYALVSLAEGTFNPTLVPVSSVSIPSARLLKAEQVLEQQTAVQLTSPASQPLSIAHITCCAYFSYILYGVDKACQVFDKALSELEELVTESNSTSSSLESLYVSQAQLVLKHASSHHIKPQILRGILQQALRHFPSQPWFLQNYIESERQSFISGDLRRFFSAQAPQCRNAVVWMFTLLAEVDRHDRLSKIVSEGECVDEPVSGLLHRVDAVLARACQASNGRLCPALWRLHMKFKVDCGRSEEGKAVFYQAIHQCPWSKLLYCDAIMYFPEEANKIIEIAEEKEIRIRVPFEEAKLLWSAVNEEL